ncbi:MAG: hypothetical protein IKY84_06735 [Bacteroidaceae bacterium]|nr:hypothetical protein [Bacteroidaceae bacterium]
MESKIIEKVRGRMMRKMAVVEGNITTCTEKFSEDYEKFLNWYAEDLYKNKKLLEYYKGLLTTISVGDLSYLKETLRHHVEHLGDDILHGSLRKSSTNSFANLAHVLDLEVKQTVITVCSVMLSEITELERQ